jgi:hypothetical protein
MFTSFSANADNKIRNKVITCLFFTTALLITPITAFGALSIDGILNEPEWADAQSFRDFVVIDPLSLETPRLPTETRLLSLPEGLAVAFICEQPPGETRTSTPTQLDAQEFYSDSVSLMIDFDGTSKIAYEFSVSIAGSYRDGTITGEIFTNYDWDGLWERAINEESDRWTVEILLPWSIAVMREVDGDSRVVGVSFQRTLHSRDETFAFPAATLRGARFISDFAKAEIPIHRAQEFDVWPYVTILSDQVKDSIKGKAGLDLYWKPINRFQVIATMNPDFGQVESDNLVIDFSALEVTFNDKRPFFTENQGIFNLKNMPRNDLFYTRRIGGPSDDGKPSSDIDAAVKIIGSAGYFDYGIFAAQEAGDAGRSFYSGRLVLPAENWTLGTMANYVERPYLDRTSLVNVIDVDLRLGDTIHWLAKFFSSDIESPIKDEFGFGSYTIISYDPSEHWNSKFTFSYYDDTVDINDMGQFSRNSVIEGYLYTELVRTDLPEDSRFSSLSWTLQFVLGENTDGDRFPVILNVGRRMKMRSGSNLSMNVEYKMEGYDDLVSRGNGLVKLADRLKFTGSYTTQRKGAWSGSLRMEIFQEGIEDWGIGLSPTISWYPNEKLNLDFSLKPRWSRDWLIWLRGDQFASFYNRQITGEIGGAWFPAEKHEVRLRTQWYVINADTEQAYRIGPNAYLVPTNDPVSSFDMINFGLQLRYRYEIAPLSDLYLVYSRGGIERINNSDRSTLSLLGDSTVLRNADQILVKLRYRF